MKTILIVEDEEPIREGLSDAFKQEGYKILPAKDGNFGYKAVLTKKPDLVILDLMLPGLSGLDVCKKLRSGSNQTPIIMLTAKSTEADKIVGLELGADDYVTKPFSVRELLSRVKALLRRSESRSEKKEGAKKLVFDDVKVDFLKFKAEKAGRKLEISKTEFKILRFFATRCEEVISREAFLDEVWGYDEFPTTRTVDNFIVKLRSKIEKTPKKPKHLITIYGVGYKFIT